MNTIDPNRPLHMLLPVEGIYQHMLYAISDAQSGFGEFTVQEFASFIEDIVSVILPSTHINGYASASEKASLYVGYLETPKLLQEVLSDLNIQIRYLNLPVYPAAGFIYRFYLTSDMNLNIHYEHSSHDKQIKLTHTRTDILACIENGDYVSEKLRREYGI